MRDLNAMGKRTKIAKPEQPQEFRPATDDEVAAVHAEDRIILAKARKAGFALLVRGNTWKLARGPRSIVVQHDALRRIHAADLGVDKYQR